MPTQTAFTRPTSIRTRPPNRVPSTAVTNELAEAINGLNVLPKFGQVIEPVVAISQSPSKGQYQGMNNTMVTNNAVGWGFPQFIPPLDE